MLDERDADRVEIEIISVSPARFRVRGPARAAAEAAKALAEDAPHLAPIVEPPLEVMGADAYPLPARERVLEWLKTRGREPYELAQLVAEVAGEHPERVKERFYVVAGAPGREKKVGSKYRAACAERHRGAIRELEIAGWRVEETKEGRGPTFFRVVPPREAHAGT